MTTHSSIHAWKNPVDRRAWRITVPGVAKSQTQLSTNTQMNEETSDKWKWRNTLQNNCPILFKITRSKRSRKQWGRVYDTISTWPWTGSFHHKVHSWENWPNSSGVWGYSDGDESQLISWCYGCMAVMEEDVLVCRNTRWRIWFWWVIRFATYS